MWKGFEECTLDVPDRQTASPQPISLGGLVSTPTTLQSLMEICRHLCKHLVSTLWSGAEAALLDRSSARYVLPARSRVLDSNYPWPPQQTTYCQVVQGCCVLSLRDVGSRWGNPNRRHHSLPTTIEHRFSQEAREEGACPLIGSLSLPSIRARADQSTNKAGGTACGGRRVWAPSF